MIRRHILLSLTPAERKTADEWQARTRLVTEARRECKCTWCSSQPRSPGWLTVNYSGE